MTVLAVSGLWACSASHDEHALECGMPAMSEHVIPGGIYEVGTNTGYPEEGPVTQVEIPGFAIDTTEITNAQFQRFVEATGYKTRAERGLTEAEFDDLPQALRVPGSSVFTSPQDGRAQSIIDWWKFIPGASWRAPQGPGSSVEGMDLYPVVHIAYEDAVAYARWAGRRLPTEDEWEVAARGGLVGARYAWGSEKPDDGIPKANTWQGFFPYTNSADDGYAGLAPVGCFAPNDYGLYDMTGNVWEWTSTPYSVRRDARPSVKGDDPDQPGIAVNVVKGGSYLCAENYCQRYRPAARHSQDLILGTSHIGFRTVRDLTAEEKSPL